ncbi:MAG: Flp pilus assembly protein CpaB [Proteobacteria bacterium]|nr:Flp pilus assembly protein CpaB [Pseudomonadota bacterium]
MTIVLIVVALTVAGLTAFLVNRYLQSQVAPSIAEDQRPGIAAVEVLVAERDLAAGTILMNEDLTWRAWPEDGVDGSYVLADETDIDEEFVGLVVKRGIGQGEPITADKVFKRSEAGFLAGAVSPGMRAVSIAVNPVSGAAGFVSPGDRIDVILTVEIRKALVRTDEGQDVIGPVVQFSSETVLKDVRVLAIDQSMADLDKDAQVSKTVTLEVTPKQAELLAVASTMGILSLSLRSLTPGEIAEGEIGYTSDREISEAVRASILAQAGIEGPVSGEEASAFAQRKKLKVYRSSALTTLEFSSQK